MKKTKNKIIFFIVFIFIFICILFFYYINCTNKINNTDQAIIITCPPRPPFYDLIDPEQRESELKETAEGYSLNFEVGKEEDANLLKEYYIRGVTNPGGDYRTYDETFYEAYIENHTIPPDFIDKEHKIALFFQTDAGWEDSWYASRNEEPSLDALGETDIYLMKAINNTESAVKIEQPFQNEDHYTVIYVYLGFLQYIYYQYGGISAFQPYLEKAFESLGYINDKGQKKGDLF